MKLKLFKTTITALAICLTAASFCRAQTIAVQQPDTITQSDVISDVVVNANPPMVSADLNTQTLQATLDKVETKLKSLDIKANAQVAIAMNDLAAVKVNVKTITSTEGDGNGTRNDDNYTSGEKNRDDVNQVKTYSKTYPADAGDMLVIDNHYGNITVNTWDKNQFKVDVQIKAEAGSMDEVQKLLDNVNISDTKNGATVAFRTEIGKASTSWLSWITGGHAGHKIEIDYTVYMPAKNDLTVANRYGSVMLPDLDGKVTVDCAYGNLTAGSLSNPNTAIELRYGSAKIENLGSAALNISYGSLNIGAVDKLNANVSYSPVKIGKLNVSASINLRYGGGLKIGDVGKDMKSLAVNSSYSNIDLGLSSDENASFAVTVHYGDFNYGDRNITFTGKTPDDSRGFHPTKSFKGFLGKGNPDKNISINSDYGNVKFE